jgi:hypothetical protein
MRVVDILTRASGGADGPLDWPLHCVEHDGSVPIAPGATRMAVEEYRDWLARHAAEWDAWRKAHPEPSPPPPPLVPLPRLAFIALVEDGLGLGYDTLPALIDQHVNDAAIARRVKRALVHAATFSADDEPLDGIGALRWLAARLGVTEAQFDALWRAAGG